MRPAPRAAAAALALLLAALTALGAAAARAPQRPTSAIVAGEREGSMTMLSAEWDKPVRVGPRLVEKRLVFPAALVSANAGGDAGLPIVDPPER